MQCDEHCFSGAVLPGTIDSQVQEEETARGRK